MTFQLQLFTVMEWSDIDQRAVVLGLHKCGRKRYPSDVAFARNYTRFRAIKLLGKTGGVIDRPITGRPQTVIALQVVNAVAARFHRKPMRKKRILSREKSISQKFITRMVKEDSRLSAQRRNTIHLLTIALMVQQKKKQTPALREQRSQKNFVYHRKRFHRREMVQYTE